ncbi:sensor histidine kinase [Mangrovihabitans endophyticus]|uniref:histidine kinase n=1 Tax=Mangrovihabitans endophyticus TaxID=1751298 RepID=A0A8J3BV14_9ACTN|nr:histidine kinase [Mangrovihabitans endophyticus]GGK72337.1 hypothetical protein GCM10012284_02680 [Mangrovihabitans endophyticus]
MPGLPYGAERAVEEDAAVRVGLVGRVLLSAGVPTLLAVAAFVAMMVSVGHLRDTQSRAATSQALVIAAEGLSRAVGQVELADRGALLADPAASEARRQAAQRARRQAQNLVALAGDEPGTGARAGQVVAAARAYLDMPAPAAGAGIAPRETDLLAVFTSRLETFLGGERETVTALESDADAATQRAVAAAVVGLIASLVAVVGLGIYLTGAVTLPVRRAAEAAREFTGGELTTRLPVGGAREIRDLHQALNTMAAALATAREQLAASRARIMSAGWQDRRELERNLHDGLQQRLVALGLDVRALQADLAGEPDGLRDQVAEIGDALTAATAELREVVHGIQPAVLTSSGLPAALRAMARRSPLPVEVAADLPGRLPPDVESALYYIASEAVTNAVKHARAGYVRVDVRVRDGAARLEVGDDGVGGADERGSGLVGLRDRIEATGGRMLVDSVPGTGTTLTATVPLDEESTPRYP